MSYSDVDLFFEYLSVLLVSPTKLTFRGVISGEHTVDGKDYDSEIIVNREDLEIIFREKQTDEIAWYPDQPAVGKCQVVRAKKTRI